MSRRNEDLIRTAIDRIAGSVQLGNPERVIQRAGRRAMWRKVGTVGVAAAIAVTGLTGGFLAFGPGNGVRPDALTGAVQAAPTNGQLITSNTGWVLAQNGLLLTDDGGSTWSNINPSGVSGTSIKGVFFLDVQDGWLLTNASTQDGTSEIDLFSTKDGGSTWSKQILDRGAVFAESATNPAYIDFVDPTHGWVNVVLASSSNRPVGELFASGDGESWTSSPAPAGGPIAFVDQDHGWASDGQADGQLFMTSDGGQSWNPANLTVPDGQASSQMFVGIPTFSGSPASQLAVTFIDGGSSATVATYATDDRGASWTLGDSVSVDSAGGDVVLPTSTAGNGLFGISSDGSTEFTASAAGKITISTTTPGGLPAGEGVYVVSFVDSNTGWAFLQGGSCSDFKTSCATSASLVATSDGGSNWHPVAVSIPAGSATPAGV